MTDLIERHIAHIRAAGYSPLTIRARVRCLRAFDRYLQPHGLENAATHELEEHLGRPGWCNKTRETYWSHLIPFYRWAVQTEHLDWDPTVGIQRPRVSRRLPRPVTADQVRVAITQLARPWSLIALFATAAGMRCGEIAAAQREDIDEERILITGKGGRFRSVPTDPLIWAMVRSLPPGPIITWRGAPVTGNWVSARMSYHLRQLGLSVTAHRYRHWFGTVVQREYRDLRVTQELLGHSSPATTAGYAAVTDGQRRNAIATLSAALTTTLSGAA